MVVDAVGKNTDEASRSLNFTFIIHPNEMYILVFPKFNFTSRKSSFVKLLLLLLVYTVKKSS